MKHFAPLSLIAVAAFVLPAWGQQPQPDAGKPRGPRQIQAPATIQKPPLKKKEETPKKVLAVGDPAPEFKVEAFVKGEPVKSFVKGRVYVVEFWATWCGPCIMAFPHLSELQAQYKDKVTVIGTNVIERSYDATTLDKIRAFVEGQGDKMAYTVAYDGKSLGMFNAYMQAANQGGIPCAFIVNQDGKVAWIGHPGEMNDVLKQVVEGTFDLKAAAEKASAATNAQGRIKEILTNMDKASRAFKWDEVVAGLDELIRIDPDNAGRYLDRKFKILVIKKNDYAAAYAMKDALLAEPQLAQDGRKLMEIAWTVVRPDGEVPAKERNLDFAMTFAVKADEVSNHEDIEVIDTLARVYWEKGERPKAIELQEKALKTAEAGTEATQRKKEELKATLDWYKKEAAKPGA